VEFESPHRGVSRKKLLQKFTRAPCLLILLSEQDLSDSNFPGAAYMILGMARIKTETTGLGRCSPPRGAQGRQHTPRWTRDA
jgi:hypothetical protein